MATNTAGDVGRLYQTHQVHYLRKYFTKDDAGNTLDMGYLPPGANVVDGGISVIEAFNAGTNNRANLGVSTDVDDFGTLLALGTVGIIKMDETATCIDHYATTAQLVQVQVDVTGTAATTGKAIAWVAFLVPDGLVGSA